MGRPGVSAVLLDTCAILWLAAGVAPHDDVTALIEAARRDDAVLVSPISAWEIAQKHATRPDDLGLQETPLAFWRRFATQAGVRAVALTPEILVASTGIDGLATKDPVDRMIVATGQAMAARVVTGDRRILAYMPDAIAYGRAI